MPCSHTGLYGHDDRHTTHGEGDASHREREVTRALKGKESKVEVAEVTDPDEHRQQEESPPVRHPLDAQHPPAYVHEELRNPTGASGAKEPDEDAQHRKS